MYFVIHQYKPLHMPQQAQIEPNYACSITSDIPIKTQLTHSAIKVTAMPKKVAMCLRRQYNQWSRSTGCGISGKRILWEHDRVGPRTNGFSIAIKIRWKFRFTLTSILLQWISDRCKICTWQDSCAAVICAKIVAMWRQANVITARQIFHRMWIAPGNCGQEIFSETAPGPNQMLLTLICLNVLFLEEFFIITKIR